jgi:hypothetical protein
VEAGNSDAPGDEGPGPRLARLEARVARIEAELGLVAAAPEPRVAEGAPAAETGEDLEFKLGQAWFARAGIAALGIGFAFTLSLPFPSLPAAAPAAAGYAAAALLVLAAARLGRVLGAATGPLRATALALVCFSGIRLGYLGGAHALDPGSAAGMSAMVLGAAANLALAVRWRSQPLLGLALATAYASALALGSAAWGLGLVSVVSAAAALGAARRLGPAPVLAAMPLAYVALAVWALNNPLLGRPVAALDGPAWGPVALLACLASFSLGLRRSSRSGGDDVPADAGVFLNALVFYGVYLPHTLASHASAFVGWQLAASAVLIALAFLHSREGDRVGSFVCAMTGFFALSFAIIRAAPSPDVFVWLSLQSVIVVATAVWLRSRFIVVANFAIYLAILGCYVATADRERGISLGFGIVALATARLLGWQQQRLELRTGFMRNAYLSAAFLIFPYSLYHLVPGAWVGLAWVGAALLYYLLSALLHNPKYRWMAHGTLVLTVLYLAFVGISRLEPFARNLSFLVLGAVLVAVSLVLSRVRRRR